MSFSIEVSLSTLTTRKIIFLHNGYQLIESFSLTKNANEEEEEEEKTIVDE